MKNIVIFMMVLAISGCATKRHSIYWLHSNYPENTEQEKRIAQEVFNRVWSQCNQLAFRNVQKPSNATKARVYTPPTISNSSHVDLGAYTRGVEAANRPDPHRIYQSNLRQYIYSCVQSKGWVAYQK